MGAANALVYAIATRLYTDILPINAAIASGMGYATSIPMAFFGHRNLTFGAKGPMPQEFARFVGSQLFGFFISMCIAWIITDQMGYPIWLAVAVTVIAAPILSYFAMTKWVFHH